MLYHLQHKNHKRKDGRNAVALAAYRAGEKLYDDRTGKTYSSGDPDRISHKEILLPDSAPRRFLDRQTLWGEVEQVEKRKDSQLCREFEISLQQEFTKEQNISAARKFSQQFVDEGLIADMCFHGLDTHNPHVHIMLTTRELTPTGFGKKIRKHSNSGKDWYNKKDEMEYWRESWATIVNQQFEAIEQFEEVTVPKRVDHRSYERQGLDIQPTRRIPAEEYRANNPEVQAVKQQRKFNKMYLLQRFAVLIAKRAYEKTKQKVQQILLDRKLIAESKQEFKASQQQPKYRGGLNQLIADKTRDEPKPQRAPPRRKPPDDDLGYSMS
jgi:ATP-dependent exoDNAse (exonuclease V) alpha subunit